MSFLSIITLFDHRQSAREKIVQFEAFFAASPQRKSKKRGLRYWVDNKIFIFYNFEI